LCVIERESGCILTRTGQSIRRARIVMVDPCNDLGCTAMASLTKRKPRNSKGLSRPRVWFGNTVVAVLRRFGRDLIPYGPGEEQVRRAKLLNSLGITLVLDVGANEGQYAKDLRRAGYEGRIVSFEPRSDTFAKLEAASAEDPRWDATKLAIGERDGTAEINVAGNEAGASSSLLEMGERHERSAPDSRYIGTEEVELRRLDSLWGEVVRPEDRVFIKLDIQGYEMQALAGADGVLDAAAGVQAELSLVPLYEGAAGYREMLDLLEARGFRLAGLEAGFGDFVTGEMLQADGLFIRD
jgi:FkbM family methyltransferase